jgi:hypothetical protein
LGVFVQDCSTELKRYLPVERGKSVQLALEDAVEERARFDVDLARFGYDRDHERRIRIRDGGVARLGPVADVDADASGHFE